jgi:hypothetical protein
MNQKIYQEKDLPWAELEELGLASKGKLLLEKSDKEALLSGRRTSLQQLSDIKDGSLHISAIDVKLSIKPDAAGKLQLQAHPIHKYPQQPAALTELEAVQFVSGQIDILHKTVPGADGKQKEVFYEYDSETHEFIESDPLQITVPDRINGEEVTPAQRERYRKGKEIELSDGTNLRYTGVDPDPVRSNRLMLVASILVDGGLTYLAYHALKAFRGSTNHHPDAAHQSEGYKKAKSEMDQHTRKPEASQNIDTGHTREYTRTGRSR